MFSNQYDRRNLTHITDDVGTDVCKFLTQPSGGNPDPGELKSEDCQKSFTGSSQTTPVALCEKTDCYTTGFFRCKFPFRYQGRVYDSCITLGSVNAEPWCSTRVDNKGNHVTGSFDICPVTCTVNNCPISYTRSFPDKSCHRMPPISPLHTVQDFDEAEAVCQRDGGRLYHPRNKEAWQLLLNLTGEQLQNSAPYVNAPANYVALGMKVDFTLGYPVVKYTDNTPVPPTLFGTAFQWKDATYPLNEVDKQCVAFDGLSVVNIPCTGYSDGEV